MTYYLSSVITFDVDLYHFYALLLFVCPYIRYIDKFDPYVPHLCTLKIKRVSYVGNTAG